MHGLVSILIPVYNSATTLKRCIESCLAQDYSPIEIHILNDGSTEGDYSFIEAFQSSRIHYHESNQQLGIAAARNKLIQEANGEYIAWLDADDYMLADRLSKQVAFLRRNPNIDFLGSFMSESTANSIIYKCPQQDDAIKACLTYKNCLFQPSMLCKNFFKQEGITFNPYFGNIAEDYALYVDCLQNKQFANLPLALTAYKHPSKAELQTKRSENQFEEKSLVLHKRLWERAKMTETEIKALHHFLYDTNQGRYSYDEAFNALHLLRQSSQTKADNIANAYYIFVLWAKAPFSFKLKHWKTVFHLIEAIQYTRWFSA